MNCVIAARKSGIASRGKKTPERNIIGRLMRLATGAAWSSFFAQPAIGEADGQEDRRADEHDDAAG